MSSFASKYPFLSKLLWFAALWALGVGVVGIIGYALRAVLVH